MQTTALTALYEGLLLPLLLGLPRMLALLIVFPLLPTPTFPQLLRNGVAISLLLVTYPLGMVQADLAPTSLVAWVGLIAKEALIGAVIGWAFALPIWAFEAIGAVIDIQTGSVNGAIFDPINNQAGGPWAPFMRLLGSVMFLGCGGLLVMLGTLYQSYIEWPITSAYPPSLNGVPEWSTSQIQQLMVMSVSFAAPAIAVLLAVDIGLGLVNRVAPQLNVFTLAMPVKGIAAALTVLLTMQFQFDVLGSQVTDPAPVQRSLERLMTAPAGGSPMR
jgi:type III secretion protein T